MKKFLKIVLFELWFIPIGFFLLMCGIYFHFLRISNLESTNDIVDVFLLISVFLMAISALGQFKKGGSFILGGIFQILIVIGAVGGLAYLSVLTQFFGVIRDIDDSIVEIEIDETKKIHYPVDTSLRYQSIRSDLFETEEFAGIDFKLFTLPEPGFYEYDLWLKSNVDGIVYLKVFETANDTLLSSGNLKDESSLIIESTNKAVKQFSTTSHFTIYETDPNGYYETRFEVWFIPKDGGEEVKVIERFYMIERKEK